MTLNWTKETTTRRQKTPCWPVLLLLLPRWALRTNENIIRILRENRRYFFKDDDIKHYIRNNELWQSFKRCTIAELLKIKGKYPHTFDSSESTSVTLSKASKEEDRDKRWFWNRWTLMNLISFQKQYGPKATYSAAKTLQRLFGQSRRLMWLRFRPCFLVTLTSLSSVLEWYLLMLIAITTV